MNDSEEQKFEVVHFITTLERGGAEKQLAYLVAEQIRQGLSVTVIYFKGTPELEDFFLDLGVGIFPIKNIFKRDFVTLGFKKLFYEKELILHSHLPRAELFCLLISIISRRPFVTSRHNAERFLPKSNKFLSQILSRYSTSRASTTIAISQSVKNYLVSNGEINRNASIQVVYYGFSKDTYSRIEKFDIGYLNSKTNVTRKKLVTISRLEPQKNLFRLIDAVVPILATSNCELLIYGEGSQRVDLEKYIQKRRVQNRILIKGKTSDVTSVLKTADLFILASLYEGFGMVLFEAMANNCRIAASCVSAIPEVLGNNYPFLFNPIDVYDISSKIQSCLVDKSNFFTNFTNNQLQKFPINESHQRIFAIYKKTHQIKR
jgi:glycosyltransferase involved in cell wall biosynthesis